MSSTEAPSASALPPLPAVPAPSVLPPLPTLGSAMPNLPGLPSLAAVKAASPKELKLPELPAPASPPRVPEPAPKAASPKMVETIQVPPPLPVPVAKPMTPVAKLSLARHPGLKADHFTATNEDLKDFIIKVDRAGPTPTAEVIGKITALSTGPAVSDYESKLEEISSSEVDSLKKYRIGYNYQRPAPVSFGLPNLELPGIPGMPSIPGIPGL